MNTQSKIMLSVPPWLLSHDSSKDALHWLDIRRCVCRYVAR